MPITYTRTIEDARAGEVTVKHVGRVVEVRTFEATRNCSDTLDYSDYRTVRVTEALVYVGRVVAQGKELWTGTTYLREGEAIALEHRFQWVDCTNLFTWRGQDESTPTVDVDVFLNPEIAEDHAAWKARVEEIARAAEERRVLLLKQEEERQAEIKRNTPERGKRMVVTKGRKVAIGTAGTVAWISDGRYGMRVLLKPDCAWRDRKVDGVWVDARNLEALDGRCWKGHEDCLKHFAKHPEMARACAESSIIPIPVKRVTAA